MNQIEIKKTLDQVIRSKDGLWASEKQARYIYPLVKKHLDHTPEALAWARGFADFDRKSHLAVSIKVFLRGYGVRDRSKVRVAGFLYWVDGSGVRARAKIKIQHPKGDEAPNYPLIPGTAETNYVRSVDGPVLYDAQKIQRVKEEQIKKNIDKIQSIPGWEQKDILVSFVEQLKGGRSLSSRQTQVLVQMLPRDQLDLDPTEWKINLETFDNWLSGALIPKMLVGYESIDDPVSSSDLRQWQQAYKSGSHTNHWFDSDLIRMLSELGPDPGRYRFGHLSLSEARGEVLKALKNPKRVTKKGLRVIGWLTDFVSRLPSSGRVDALIRQEFK